MSGRRWVRRSEVRRHAGLLRLRTAASARPAPDEPLATLLSVPPAHLYPLATSLSPSPPPSPPHPRMAIPTMGIHAQFAPHARTRPFPPSHGLALKPHSRGDLPNLEPHLAASPAEDFPHIPLVVLGRQAQEPPRPLQLRQPRLWGRPRAQAAAE